MDPLASSAECYLYDAAISLDTFALHQTLGRELVNGVAGGADLNFQDGGEVAHAECSVLTNGRKSLQLLACAVGFGGVLRPAVGREPVSHDVHARDELLNLL